jgi:hypothetical protein
MGTAKRAGGVLGRTVDAGRVHGKRREQTKGRF